MKKHLHSLNVRLNPAQSDDPIWDVNQLLYIVSALALFVMYLDMNYWRP
jgi:hypothetical protein